MKAFLIELGIILIAFVGGTSICVFAFDFDQEIWGAYGIGLCGGYITKLITCKIKL